MTHKLAELMRKMWNPRNFKGHANPHEVMQAIGSASHKMFKIGEQKEPTLLMSWLLNSLNLYLGTKKKSGILTNLLRGSLVAKSENLLKSTHSGADPVEEETKQGAKQFWYIDTFYYRMLSLDLPSVPLYKEGSAGLPTIPQAALESLFSKFDGKTTADDTRAGTRSTFRLVRLPRYLILAVKRFVKNEFFVEKNNTLISFPSKDIDLGNCIKSGIICLDVENKEPGKSYKYSLIAQVVHEGKPNSGTYKIQVLQRASGQWIEIQDLNVLPIMPQMVSLSESYMLVLEMQ